MDNQHIIQALDKYEFHDMPVKGIHFSMDDKLSLILFLLDYQEGDDDYTQFTLQFSEITELVSEPFIFDEKSTVEINSFDYTFQDVFECKICLLLGFGKPDLTINLKCRKIELL